MSSRPCFALARQARRAARAAQLAAQERDRARVEAAKAERINAFLPFIFASADPNWYSSGYGQRGEVKVIDMKREAEARSLLLKRYENYARLYGEQNPQAVRTRQLLDKLNESAGNP